MSVNAGRSLIGLHYWIIAVIGLAFLREPGTRRRECPRFGRVAALAWSSAFAKLSASLRAATLAASVPPTSSKRASRIS